jgi:hypothetical protein
VPGGADAGEAGTDDQDIEMLVGRFCEKLGIGHVIPS